MSPLSPSSRLTCKSLALLPAGSPAILLMRHAERKAASDEAPGPEISLTQRGIRGAEHLGAALSMPVASLHASPFPRCMDTAAAIALGARCDQSVVAEAWLGMPGPLVVDWSLAEPAYRTFGPEALLQRQLAGELLPGLRPLREGVATILRHLWATPLDAGALAIAITHDSVLAPVLATVTGWTPVAKRWPDYLDGLVLWRECETVYWAWRGDHGIALYRSEEPPPLP